MEGYALIKSDKNRLVVAISHYSRKYLVLDYKDQTLTVFHKKPPSGDSYVSSEENVKVEDIIDFELIESVEYLPDKKDGKRFNVVFQRRKSKLAVEAVYSGSSEPSLAIAGPMSGSSGPSSASASAVVSPISTSTRGSSRDILAAASEKVASGEAELYKQACLKVMAGSVAQARQWVRAITKGVAAVRMRKARVNRSSRQDESKMLQSARSRGSSIALSRSSKPRTSGSFDLGRGRKGSGAPPDDKGGLKRSTTGEGDGLSLADTKFGGASADDIANLEAEPISSFEEVKAVLFDGRRESLAGEVKIRRKSVSKVDLENKDLEIEKDMSVTTGLIEEGRFRAKSETDSFKHAATVRIRGSFGSSGSSKKLSLAEAFKPPEDAGTKTDDMAEKRKRSKSSTRRKKSRSKRIVITPFKESIWGLIEQYQKTYSGDKDYKGKSLQERTFEMLQKAIDKGDEDEASGTFVLDFKAMQEKDDYKDVLALDYDSDTLEKGADDDLGMNLSDSDGEIEESKSGDVYSLKASKEGGASDSLSVVSPKEEKPAKATVSTEIEFEVQVLVTEGSSEEVEAPKEKKLLTAPTNPLALDIPDEKKEKDKTFRMLLSYSDLNAIQKELKEKVSKFSMRYNFEKIDNLMYGSDIVNYFVKELKRVIIASPDDAMFLANELLRQDLLVMFPFSEGKKKKKPVFISERVYSFPRTSEQKKVLELAKSLEVANFDFWVREFLRSVRPAKASRGLLSTKTTASEILSFRGDDLLCWIGNNVFRTDKESVAAAFANFLLRKKIFLKPTKESAPSPTEEILSPTGASDESDAETFESSEMYIFNQALWSHLQLEIAGTPSSPPKPSWKEYVNSILQSEFHDYFCKLADDKAVLVSLLSTFDIYRNLASPSSPRSGRSFEGATDIEKSSSIKAVTSLKEHKKILYKMLVEYSCTTKEKIPAIFELEDAEAHGLAVDLFWEILRKENLESHICRNSLECIQCKETDQKFVEMAELYLSGPRCKNEFVKNSLLGVLLDSEWSLIKPIALNQRVIRPGVWKAYYLAMNYAPPALLEDYFRDGFSLMIDNSKNAVDLGMQKGWESWVLPFTVLDKPPYIECVLMSKNIIAQVLLHLFFNSDEFTRALTDVFTRVETFKIGGENAVNLAFDLLSITIAKICSNTSKFPGSVKDSREFYHLAKLTPFVTEFIFCAKDWGKRGVSGDRESDYGMHIHPTSKLFIFDRSHSICERFLELYRQIHIQDLLTSAILDSKEKSLIDTLISSMEFFRDSIKLLDALHQKQLEGQRFREEKMSHLCKRFMKGNETRREAIIASAKSTGSVTELDATAV